MNNDPFSKAVEIATTNVICKKLADEIEANPNGPEIGLKKRTLAGLIKSYPKNIDISTIERCNNLLYIQQ